MRAFQVTVDNPDHFHQLGNFEVIETGFSAVMFFDHVPSAVLDLLNMLQYVPQFIVVHVGASDFSKYNNLQQSQNIKAMMSRARARLTGAIAKNTKLAGAYIIGHDGIQAQKGQGLHYLQDPVNLSVVGNHMFMADVLIKVDKVVLPFYTVYKASQVHKAMYNACKVQARDLKGHMHNLPLQ